MQCSLSYRSLRSILAVFSALITWIPAERCEAQMLALAVDNSSDTVTVIDTEDDSIVGTVDIPVPFDAKLGDVAMTADQQWGFVTDTNNSLWMVDLTTKPPQLAAGTHQIMISTPGQDVSITPDQRFVLAAGTSIWNAPIAVVDIALRSQIHLFYMQTDVTAIEVCPNGSILVTSLTNKTVRRLTIDSSGVIADTGEVLPTGPTGPNNVFCAPDGNTGIYITRTTPRIQSFRVAALAPIHSRTLSGDTTGISGLVVPGGLNLWVRSNGVSGGQLECFQFRCPASSIGASAQIALPIMNVPSTEMFFGTDQMAVHPKGKKLYVSQPGSIEVYDAQTGALRRSITNASIVRPTGLCFASPRVALPCDPERDIQGGGER